MAQQRQRADSTGRNDYGESCFHRAWSDGVSMAGHLTAGGHDVTVYNRRRQKQKMGEVAAVREPRAKRQRIRNSFLFALGTMTIFKVLS